MMDIKVIDNFFPDGLANRLLVESEEYSWDFNRTDSNQDVYWTKFIFGDNFAVVKNKLNFLEKFTEPTVEEAWNFFSNKFNVPKENLYSVYFNGLTHGVEAHLHVDSSTSDEITVICYVCHSWNSFWSGATSFYDGEFSDDPTNKVFYTQDVQKTVLPKYNRIVIFDSSIIHSVHPISKSFKGLRTTLMFKIKNINYKDLFNGSN